MKTSNKILLGTFLAGLIILLGVQVSLYAKYKKGEFKLVGDDMWPTNMITYSLEDVKYVSVENLDNLIIRQGDSSRLRYDKPIEGDDNKLSVIQKDDTLFLSGKGSANEDGRWYSPTSLSLAGLLPLKITNSKMLVSIEQKSSRPPFPADIVLDNSFMEVSIREKNAISFGTFKINAINKSRINLHHLTTNFLDVTLKDSFFEETSLTADSIKLTTDLDSKFELSGKNLVKAKIVAYE